MSMIKRLFMPAAIVLAVIALSVVVRAPSANAESLLVSCPVGHETATYNPGLTLTPRQVHVQAEGTIGACIDVVGERANGVIAFQGNGQLTCLAGNASGTGSVNWEPSGIPTTTFTWQGVVGVRPLGNAVLVLTGTVTSSDFQEALVQAEFVLTTTLQQSLQCLTSKGTETNSGVVAAFTIIDI